MMGRRMVISLTLLALMIGVNSQALQQWYLPSGRFFGREWNLVTRTQDQRGQPSGTMVSRIRQGFLVSSSQDQMMSGDEQAWIPTSYTVAVEPQASLVRGGSLEPEHLPMEQAPTSGADFVLPIAIESQTGSDPDHPVVVDAEENKFVINQRKKRDSIFDRLSPSRFLSNRRGRDTRGAKKSAVEGTSKGIMDKRVIPVVEDVDETPEKDAARHKRGTDDNLSSWQYYFRSPRDLESMLHKITSRSTSGAEGRRRRSVDKRSFEIPFFSELFDV
ncbi:hypothetical protein GE061_007032 [Apolygus lucorum]|uniref:Uncharacterized protein n=1 Tax=Apolygus lucorum TaxID=248454 RepID=A0A6A4IVQ7_APOLU|nr:hypothetical protein GE061_007032 [Apolygus lucorum]